MLGEASCQKGGRRLDANDSELGGKEIEDDANAFARVEAPAVRDEPNRKHERLEAVGKDAAHERLRVADVSVEHADAEPVLHHLPHDEVILRHDRKVSLGEVQSKRVESLRNTPDLSMLMKSALRRS